MQGFNNKVGGIIITQLEPSGFIHMYNYPLLPWP